MKASNESRPAPAGQAGLILLLTEKLAGGGRIPEMRVISRTGGESMTLDDLDEFNQADILTSGISLAPAFPVENQWLWEFVARYSGATVPDSHGVPERLDEFAAPRGPV